MLTPAAGVHRERTTINTQMKAIVCNQPGEIKVEDRPVPEIDNGDILVKVRRVGICGTDFHIFSGEHPYLEYPRIMGHELSGEIERAHAGSRFTAGDTVIINPYLPCGRCIACRRGKPNCCVNITVLGVHDHGGLCEYLAVPETALYPAGNLSIEQGAMVEFLSIGAHAVRRGAVSQGQRVLVVGVGPIGLGTALIARLEGAEVTVLDANTARVKKARDIFGFEKAVQLSTTTTEELAALTGGEYYDVVVDATGNAKAIESGFEYVAHGGSYVLVSVVLEIISFSDPEFHKREMTLIGSRNAARQDFEYVIAQIESGALPTDELHTHSCGLMDLPGAFPDWSVAQDEMIKAIVSVGD